MAGCVPPTSPSSWSAWPPVWHRLKTAAPAPAEPADKAGRPEPRVETIRHEDTGSRIDELRVGGETKSITVKPKGDAPAYEVGPESNNRNPAAADRERGAGGSGGWKIKSF